MDLFKKKLIIVGALIICGVSIILVARWLNRLSHNADSSSSGYTCKSNTPSSPKSPCTSSSSSEESLPTYSSLAEYISIITDAVDEFAVSETFDERQFLFKKIKKTRMSLYFKIDNMVRTKFSDESDEFCIRMYSNHVIQWLQRVCRIKFSSIETASAELNDRITRIGYLASNICHLMNCFISSFQIDGDWNRRNKIYRVGVEELIVVKKIMSDLSEAQTGLVTDIKTQNTIEMLFLDLDISLVKVIEWMIK